MQHIICIYNISFTYIHEAPEFVISKPRSNFQVTDGSSMQPFEVRFPHQFSRFLNEEIELDVRDTRYEQDMNRSEYIDMLNFATCFVQLWSCKTLVLLHQ